jgi:hypothetical protein
MVSTWWIYFVTSVPIYKPETGVTSATLGSITESNSPSQADVFIDVIEKRVEGMESGVVVIHRDSFTPSFLPVNDVPLFYFSLSLLYSYNQSSKDETIKHCIVGCPSSIPRDRRKIVRKRQT